MPAKVYTASSNSSLHLPSQSLQFLPKKTRQSTPLFPPFAQLQPPQFHHTQANKRQNTEWANKKVVLFSVPGAFTPGCSARHLPGYIENLSKLKSKGVDIVAVIAFNDAWVMSAWGKANNIKGDDIVRAYASPNFLVFHKCRDKC
jgi:peroxiredoxin